VFVVLIDVCIVCSNSEWYRRATAMILLVDVS